MKKILMLTTEYPPCVGGIATYVRQVAAATSDLGCDVTVVAPDHRRDDNSEEAGLPFELVRYRGDIYHVTQLPALLRRVRHWVKVREWDVIHACDWPNIMALAFLNKLFRVDFQAIVYGTDILSMPSAWQVKMLGVRRMFEAPQRICAISNGTRELLLRTYPGVDASRVVVAWMGINADWFEEDRSPVDVRAKYGISDSAFVLLTVARLDERKGHDRVMEAINMLPEEARQNLVYLVVGGGGDSDYRAKLKALSEECRSRVVFAGEVPQREMKSVYRASDLFCMTGRQHKSRIEGFGLVYLEAASQGVTSIAGDIGGVADVVVDGETGLLVNSEDVHAIAGAILKLVRDERLRKDLGSKARERARSFTWRECARRTFEL